MQLVLLKSKFAPLVGIQNGRSILPSRIYITL